jgi:phage head maturation protease
MTQTPGILRAGYAVPLTKGGFGLLAPGEAPLAVDTSRMCATVVISHRSIDRTGDLVEPAGLDTANFARNPTVLLNHGKDYALPIGRAVDPAGRLTVKPEKDRVVATTYFAPTREGEQVFELVSQGFLNGASIGFTPLEAKPLARGGQHYLRWELLEYSHVTTPACPNAAEVLRRCLDRGRVAGAPIAEPLRKSLECMAMPAPVVVRGGWEESKHPRAENGEFGSGGRGKRPPAGSSGSMSGRAPATPNARPESGQWSSQAPATPHTPPGQSEADRPKKPARKPKPEQAEEQPVTSPEIERLLGIKNELFERAKLSGKDEDRDAFFDAQMAYQNAVDEAERQRRKPGRRKPSAGNPQGAEDKAMSKKWRKAAKPAPQQTAEAAETKAAPPPPAAGPDPAAQPPAAAPAPAAPAQADLPTLLGQLTALIGQLTTIAQPAPAPAAADAGMPPEGAAEQATDEDGDQGFGDEAEAEADEDARNSGDGESFSDDQADDAEDEEETEELLQRYRAGEPAVAKDMGESDGMAGGYVTDSMSADHKAVCRAVADHLDEMAGCEPGSTFTHSHKAAFAHHAKCMKAVCMAMDRGDAEGEAEAPAAETTEKAHELLDGDLILDALRPLSVRVTGYEDLIYSITGRKAA